MSDSLSYFSPLCCFLNRVWNSVFILLQSNISGNLWVLKVLAQLGNSGFFNFEHKLGKVNCERVLSWSLLCKQASYWPIKCKKINTLVSIVYYLWRHFDVPKRKNHFIQNLDQFQNKQAEHNPQSLNFWFCVIFEVPKKNCSKNKESTAAKIKANFVHCMHVCCLTCDEKMKAMDMDTLLNDQ